MKIKMQDGSIVEGKEIIEDTLNCWIATRINGASASLACDQGNVSINLLKAFDKIAKLEKGKVNE